MLLGRQLKTAALALRQTPTGLMEKRSGVFPKRYPVYSFAPPLGATLDKEDVGAQRAGWLAALPEACEACDADLLRLGVSERTLAHVQRDSEGLTAPRLF